MPDVVDFHTRTTSTRRISPGRPSTPRSGEKLPPRLLRCLERLDAEQLQIVEIISVAIAGGAM
jgi:hypothetical protein